MLCCYEHPGNIWGPSSEVLDPNGNNGGGVQTDGGLCEMKVKLTKLDFLNTLYFEGA